MYLPSVWPAIVLALGAFRLVRLIGWDDLTTPLRSRFTVPDAAYPMLAAWVDAWQAWGDDPWSTSRPWTGDHATREGEAPVAYLFPTTDLKGTDTAAFLTLDPFPGDRLPTRRRFYAARLVRCPWCIGFWVSVLVYVAWRVWPHATMAAMSILALSAVIGLVAKHLDQ